MMIHLGKILVRILPWDPWLPRCSKNLARSCQDSQDASKRVNPGTPRDSSIHQFRAILSISIDVEFVQRTIHFVDIKWLVDIARLATSSICALIRKTSELHLEKY